MEKYVSVQQAAETLGVDDETILAWIHSGELVAVNITKVPNGKRPTWRIGLGELGLLLLRRATVKKQLVAPKQKKRKPPPKYV